MKNVIQNLVRRARLGRAVRNAVPAIRSSRSQMLENMEARRLMSGGGSASGNWNSTGIYDNGTAIYVMTDGNHADETFNVSANGSTFTIQSDRRGTFTASLSGKTEVRLFGGDGKDTFYINRTGGPKMIVDGGKGNDTYHVGNGDLDSNIVGELIIEDNTYVNAGPQGYDTLVLSDFLDNDASTYTFNAGTIFEKPGVKIDFKGAERIEVLGTSHGDTFNLDNVPAGRVLRLDGWSGNDTFNVKPAAFNAAMTDRVSLIGGNGSDTLRVDDSSTAGDVSYQVNNQSVYRYGQAVAIRYSTFENIRLDAGAGNNTFDLASGVSGVSYTVNGAGGHDTFNFGNGDIDETMPNTTWSLLGATGNDVIRYYDNYDTGANDTYTIESQAIRKTFGNNEFVNVFFSSAESLSVSTNASSTLIEVKSLAQPTTLWAGDGNDDIRVYSSYQQNGVYHPLIVDTGTGRDSLRLDPLNNGSQSHVLFNKSQDLSVLSMGAGGVLKTAIAPVQDVTIDTNLFASTGRLDLAGNSMVVRNWPINSLDYIENQLKAGYNNGTWYSDAGSSIYSTIADDGSRAVGFGFAGELGIGVFGDAGIVGSHDLIVRSTFYGDANLDRRVDFSDLLILAQNYNAPTSARWARGDFNYDRTVGFDDLLKLAQNYNAGLLAQEAPTTDAKKDSTLATRREPAAREIVR